MLNSSNISLVYLIPVLALQLSRNVISGVAVLEYFHAISLVSEYLETWPAIIRSTDLSQKYPVDLWAKRTGLEHYREFKSS